MRLLVGARPTRESLVIDTLGISFGGLKAVSDVSTRMESGQVTSIIGPNGAGKTTLLNLICGFYKPSAGVVRLGSVDLAGQPAFKVARAGIARTFQTPQLFDQMTVLENLLVAMEGGALHSPVNDLESEAGSAAAVSRFLLRAMKTAVPNSLSWA